MFKKILLVLAVILVALAIIIARRPADFRIARTIAIAAPPTAVFAKVNDFHQWESWSPWAKLDPTMQTTYEGSTAGTGSIYSWTGNSQVGQGRMTITESHPSDFVRIKLEFIKPITATNTTDFTFQPEGSQTRVTWIMTGTNGFMSKAFDLVMNMDKMVGADFEKGLAQMKTAVESPAGR